MQFIVALLSLFIAVSAASAEPQIFEKRYEGFTIWLDCERHGAVLFKYELDADTGTLSSSGSFKTDDTVPSECQPGSGRSYRTTTVDPSTGTWDRGHLVPANHMDQTEQRMKETYFVTNILPQQSKFNQAAGAWFHTEVISECYREVSKLTIWGGMIWGNDESNDFFVNTHGITKPDFWWKVIRRHDTGEYIAWLFLNHKSATRADIDDHLIPLNDLKAELNFIPDFGALEGTQAAGQKPEPWSVTKSGSTLACEGQTTSMG